MAAAEETAPVSAPTSAAAAVEPAPVTAPMKAAKPTPAKKAHQPKPQQEQMSQSAAPPEPVVRRLLRQILRLLRNRATLRHPEPQKVTIPSGASLAVRLVDPIDSASAQVGDTVSRYAGAPVAVDGEVVIPAHYDVYGHVVDAQSSGKFAGKALLELQLDRIKAGRPVVQRHD